MFSSVAVRRRPYHTPAGEVLSSFRAAVANNDQFDLSYYCEQAPIVTLLTQGEDRTADHSFKVYGPIHDKKLQEETISNSQDMVTFLARKCDSGVKIKVAFLIPWGEDHWKMRPDYYEVLFNCWRGCRNLLNEESEVAVQSDAGYLDLLVEILVSGPLFFLLFFLSLAPFPRGFLWVAALFSKK